MKRLRDIIESMNEHEANFYDLLKKHYPNGVDVYHETPGHAADSIRKHGLKGDYGVFGTIGQHSNFVIVPKKTITHFIVPHSHIRNGGMVPDMGYGFKDDGEISPHLDFIQRHPQAKGGDISLNTEKIPHHWIKSIKEVG